MSTSICAWSLGPKNLSFVSVSLHSYPFSIFWVHSEINQTKPPSLQSTLLPDPFSLAPIHYYHSIPHPFYSRLSTCLHTFDDLYFHFALLHLPPLSVSSSFCLLAAFFPITQ
jgi:hypothetical protein